MFRFVEEFVLQAHDSIFLLGPMHRSVSGIDQVVAEGQVGAVFLNDAEGQATRILPLLDSAGEIRRC